MNAFALSITSLSSTGEGIGAIDGYKYFVDGALPGELVNVVILAKKKNYAKAKLQSIITSSADRVVPICPLFGECGGCQIMHLSYLAQLQVKQRRVVDALERIAHIEAPVAPCIASPSPLAYRNKIQLPISFEEGKRKMGLYKKASHEIIPIEKCFIQCSQGEEIFESLSPLLTLPSLRSLCIKNAVTTQESLVILVTDGSCPEKTALLAEKIALTPHIKGVVENVNLRDDNVLFSPHFRTLRGRPYIYEKLNLGTHSKIFRISAPSFFQVNSWQAMNLISYVIKVADIKKGDTVLDAFCGVGTFSLFAADHAKSVIGIEVAPQAIADARENARLNEKVNTSFFVGKAEDLIPTLADFDIVLLNPPRKGCEPRLISELSRKKPKTIIYISCDPATVARDLSSLHLAGYKIECVQPFDMFPQTMHVETVVKLYWR